MNYQMIVNGYVQGVGFRYFVKRNAQLLNVNGWVKNLENGDVEIIAQCSEFVFEKFLEIVKQGNNYSDVKKVNVNKIKEESYSSFEIL